MEQRNNVRILSQSIEECVKAFQELKWVEYSKLKPGSIFVVKNIIKVVNVNRKLDNGFLE